MNSVEIKLGYKGPYRDIKRAINRCYYNDRILVHKGEYIAQKDIFIGFDSQIIGLSNRDSVKIKCHRDFGINTNMQVMLKNVTITSSGITVHRSGILNANNCIFNNQDEETII